MKKIIYSWNNVNYEYPSCGGSTGLVYADGQVVVTNYSNILGQTTDDQSVWQLLQDALRAITIDPSHHYNQYSTWGDMIAGKGIAYIATLRKSTRGFLVR